MRTTNPLRQVVREALRKGGGRAGTPSSSRMRTAGTATPGTGVPDSTSSINLTPSTYFRIGISSIGGTDQIA